MTNRFGYQAIANLGKDSHFQKADMRESQRERVRDRQTEQDRQTDRQRETVRERERDKERDDVCTLIYLIFTLSCSHDKNHGNFLDKEGLDRVVLETKKTKNPAAAKIVRKEFYEAS